MYGKYVAIEGISFVGKSTQMSLFANNNPEWVTTREPGGTPLGLKLEKSIKQTRMCDRTRYMMLLADRSHTHSTVVAPSLDKGVSVLTDRSALSGLAYGLSDMDPYSPDELDYMLAMQKFACQGSYPDKIILLTHSSEEALLTREPSLLDKDLIEQKGATYLMRVQHNLVELAPLFSNDVLEIDAALPAYDTHTLISNFIKS